MKIKYRSKAFQPASRILIDKCDEIITDYQQQGYMLTLRQLYYQLVSRDIIPNLERSYKNLSSLVTDARMAGLLDWDAIEDRGRLPRAQSDYKDISEVVEAAFYSYRLPRWKGQFSYVELWVEKDALAGVLSPIARKWHITLAVNKGYSSASAMKRAADRFRNQYQQGHLLYLGDHDPSGEDMVRDIRDRLAVFEAPDVEVVKVALNMDQIRKYKPPPNPAKITDPRAKDYIKKYGHESWEVDALTPTVLTALIEKQISSLVNKTTMDQVIQQEKIDKKQLWAAMRSAGLTSKKEPLI